MSRFQILFWSQKQAYKCTEYLVRPRFSILVRNKRNVVFVYKDTRFLHFSLIFVSSFHLLIRTVITRNHIFITFRDTSCRGSNFTEQSVKFKIIYLFTNSTIAPFSELLLLWSIIWSKRCKTCQLFIINGTNAHYYMRYHKPSLVQNLYQARYGRTKFHAIMKEIWIWNLMKRVKQE